MLHYVSSHDQNQAAIVSHSIAIQQSVAATELLPVGSRVTAVYSVMEPFEFCGQFLSDVLLVILHYASLRLIKGFYSCFIKQINVTW